MLSVVSVGVIAAVVTIAASVIYFDSLGDIALTREISNDTSANHDIVIRGREVDIDASSNRQLLELVDIAVNEIASSIITETTLAYGSPTLLVRQDETPEEEIDSSLRAVLINAPELRGNSVLTDGAWPSNQASVGEIEQGQMLIDVALDEAVAIEFGYSVGDTVVVEPFWDDLNDSLAVKITGLFARNEANPRFWASIEDQFGLDDEDLNYLPFIPDPGVFESSVGPYFPGMTVRYSWRYHVDSSRVRASDANDLLLGFDELKAQLQPKIGSYSQSIPLQDVLTRNQQQTFFSRLPMTVVFSVIAAVVL